MFVSASGFGDGAPPKYIQFPTGVTLGRGDLKVGTIKGTQSCFMEGVSQ